VEVSQRCLEGVAACTCNTTDTMSLCNSEENAYNVACKDAAGSSNFAVTVSKAQKAGNFMQDQCASTMCRLSTLLTESITQTASLPNVHIVDANGAGSCSVFASAQSSSVRSRDNSAAAKISEVTPDCITSDTLAAAELSLDLSPVQHQMLLNCQAPRPVGFALDSSGASGAGRKTS